MCKRTTERPELIKYLNAVLHQGRADGEGPETRRTWSSVGILINNPVGIHSDKNNLRGSRNYVTNVGNFRGGQLWYEQPDGGVWRTDRNGTNIEGTLLDAKDQIVEIDPRRRHALEPWTGDRITIVAYTVRSFPEANREERKVLRELGFPLPTARTMREYRQQREREAQTKVSHSSGPRPRPSTRRSLWKTAACVSVMMSTMLSTMASYHDYQAARREVPECSVLEVGGVDATCRVSECYGNEVSVAEPILFEDIIDYNVTAPLFGAVETGVIKQSPGELWLHVRDEWHKEEVLKDINEAIARQLRERRAVVFQRDTKEDALWEAIGTGWENDGYRVNHDFIDDNTAIVRVCWPEVDNEVHVNEVMAGEAAEGSGGNPRRAKAIRFPAGVPVLLQALEGCQAGYLGRTRDGHRL